MTEVKGATLTHKVFQTRSFAWLWAVVRVWLGWQWLSAGWGKLFSPAWMQGGAALKGFLTGATALNDAGTGPVTYGWFRGMLQYLLEGGHYAWFAKLVVLGEVLVGVGLILGAFTAIAAFFGAAMNVSFMLAGTASTNPVLFIVAILLMAAWKTAGWYGLDRWLLAEVGTPWQPGRAIARKDKGLPEAG